tara:strand:- start:4726 stop:4914 length:189 start_codon:yes stop_codon:yes gene_type:complete
MGRMKDLAIEQEEARLEYLYEKHYVDAMLIEAERREQEEQWYKEIQAQESVIEETIRENTDE